MSGRNLSFVLISVVLALPVGCGRSTTVTTPDGGEVIVKEKGDEIDLTITGPEGETLTMRGGESPVVVPDDFPKDVPLIQDAKPTQVVRMGEMTTVTLETSKTASEVAAYYGKVLVANGWTIEVSMEMEEGAMVAGTKAKRAVQAMATKRGESGAVVTLSVSNSR